MTRIAATRRQGPIRNSSLAAESDDDEYGSCRRDYDQNAKRAEPILHDHSGWTSTDKDEYESDIRNTDDECHGGSRTDESYRSMVTTSRRNGNSEPQDISTRDENESAEVATDHDEDNTDASSSGSRNETVQPPPLHDASIDMQTTIYVLQGFLKRAGYRRSTSRALTLVHTKDCYKKVSTKAWILNQAHIAAVNHGSLPNGDGTSHGDSTSVSSDSAWLDTKLVDVLLGQVGALDHIAQCLHYDFLWMDSLEHELESTLHSHPPRSVTTLPKRAHASKKHVR